MKIRFIQKLSDVWFQEKYITAEKSITENPRRNVRFLSWRTFFVGKFSIQSTNEMAFKHYAIWRHQIRMLLRYFRSVDARMRTQNSLLFAVYILSVN